MKRLILIVLSLACVFGLIGCSGYAGNSNSGPFGNGESTVYEPHREDFSPEIEDSILNQFDNNTAVLKTYILRSNDWFLSDELTDFSQVVTNDVMYIASSEDLGYSIYVAKENGTIEKESSAIPPTNVSTPYGFVGLTNEIIEETLSGIEYEDYIVTYAPKWSSVFVWVRGKSGDIVISYPTRPEFLGLENGKIYTFNELTSALTKAYNE